MASSGAVALVGFSLVALFTIYYVHSSQKEQRERMRRNVYKELLEERRSKSAEKSL
jgi:hypothetical protein